MFLDILSFSILYGRNVFESSFEVSPLQKATKALESYTFLMNSRKFSSWVDICLLQLGRTSDITYNIRRSLEVLGQRRFSYTVTSQLSAQALIRLFGLMDGSFFKGVLVY